jgi:hypothetical protein
MPPGGIRTRNPISDRPQTYALDRAATGIGPLVIEYRVKAMSSGIMGHERYTMRMTNLLTLYKRIHGRSRILRNVGNEYLPDYTVSHTRIHQTKHCCLKSAS